MSRRRLGLTVAVTIASLAMLIGGASRAGGVRPKSGCRYHWPYLRKRVEVPLNHEFGYTPTFWRRWDEDPEAQFSPPQMIFHETEEVPAREENLPAPDEGYEPGYEPEPGFDESTEPMEEGFEPDESMLPGGNEPELPAEEPNFPVEGLPGELQEEPAPPEGETPAPAAMPEEEQALPPPETPFEDPGPPADAFEEPATMPDESTTPSVPEAGRGRQAQRMYIDDTQASAVGEAFARPASHEDSFLGDSYDESPEIDWPEMVDAGQEAVPLEYEYETADDANEDVSLQDVGRGFNRAARKPDYEATPAVVEENSSEEPRWTPPHASPTTTRSSTARAFAILDGPQLEAADAPPANPLPADTLPEEESLPVSVTDQAPAAAAPQWRSGSPRPAATDSRQWSRPGASPSAASGNRPAANSVPLGQRVGASFSSSQRNRPLSSQSTRVPRRADSAVRQASGEIQMGRVAPASYYETAKPQKSKLGGLFGGLFGGDK
ncbi:MAG: hypothetical protein AB7U73_08730 [Pirellulales bacterium]